MADAFSRDQWAIVRSAAVESGLLASSRLNELTSDPSPLVRRAVAASQTCDLAAALTLAEDPDADTRQRIMRFQARRLPLPLHLLAEHARSMAERGLLRSVVVDWQLGDRRGWWDVATSDTCDELHASLMALLVKTHIERWAAHPHPRVRAATGHNLFAGPIVRPTLRADGDPDVAYLWRSDAQAQGY